MSSPPMCAAALEPVELQERHPAERAPLARPHGRRAENVIIAAALSAMILLPVADIIARGFHSGITNTAGLVQHLTLVIGMAGGALAARDGRLLALSTASWLPFPWAERARSCSHAIAATTSSVLALAAIQFVEVERTAGQRFIGEIPLWVVQSVLPIGFAIIAVRLWLRTATSWQGRIVSAVVVGAFVCAFGFERIPHTAGLIAGLAVILAGTALGGPIFAAIGGAGLVLFWAADLPIASMAVEHYRLTVNPALPSIPLFTVAGFVMAEGAASRRLLRLFQSLCGGFRGGPVVAVTLICAFFTAFTGASGVTILALSALLLPVLRGANLSERNALGMMTGAGSLGVLLPPCLPVILYAIIARTDIKAMFLGGLVPGILLIVLTAAWGVWVGRRHGATKTLTLGEAGATGVRAFDLREIRAALWDAKWELLIPAGAVAAIFGGWATPVGASALTAAAAVVVGFFVHRDLQFVRDGLRIAAEAGLLVGGVLLILGVALGLTNYLIDAQVPDRLVEWAAVHVHSRWLFLLGLNVVLIAVGSFVEIYAAIVVLAPLLVPIGARLGLDPVHLGIVFLANMELGFLAPPVGLNLLLASYRLNKPVGEVTRAVLPLLVLMFLGVLLITYCPALTTTLPRLFSTSP
jgi:C4-dicarboxylate transporter DctM subunit